MEGSWLRKGGVSDGRCVATESEEKLKRRASKHLNREHFSVGATMDMTAQQKQIPVSQEKQPWWGGVSLPSDRLCQRSGLQSEADSRGHTERSAQTHAGSSVVEKLQAETPILDFSFTKGKQVRTKLSQAFNHWLNVPDDKLQVIITVTEMLHNASLLIDDIEDSSKLRRGFPVAHSIYGIPSVINSANYVYFLGLEKVLTLDHPEAVQVFTQQLLELHRGQGLDIHWRDTYTCPTEQEYRNMVLQKTGGLFGLAVGLMQLFSDWKQDLKPLLDTLGLFFQIRDDYANLSSHEYSENKSFCEDLTEGKFSFPTIHAIWSRPESTQVQNILRQRTENMDIKRYCVDYLEKVGSFAYTRQTLRDLEVEAYRLIGELGGNPQLESLVKHLSQMHHEAEATAESRTEPRHSHSP
ncbi:geranylgeranyl pyrophosphate synthase isoform X2 [Micropterus salmoides]|uniref:geranylgeranyl pyrophosphate synthase isoform X2 n=1 Tax=Micropterus salmoides TaxID=27706 RepID=UPI0018ED9CE8|nr:geranylgeranyl pyrophosphate synthase isoform X2 [Micropterus salmoides]